MIETVFKLPRAAIFVSHVELVKIEKKKSDTRREYKRGESSKHSSQKLSTFQYLIETQCTFLRYISLIGVYVVYCIISIHSNSFAMNQSFGFFNYY